MTVRTVIKLADWTLGVDRTPGASGPVFEIQCTTCHEAPEPTADPATQEFWALSHTGSHPEHRSYRSVTTAFFRVSPAPGNPLHEDAPTP